MEVTIHLFLIFELLYLSHAHLLPEDSQTDTEELLNREKRDDAFTDIIKSIPFFKNIFPSPSSLNDDDDPNGDTEEDALQALLTSTSATINTSSHMLSRSFILSSSIAPTPSLSSILQTTVSVFATSKTPLLLTTHTSKLSTNSMISTQGPSSILMTSSSMKIKPSSSQQSTRNATSTTTKSSMLLSSTHSVHVSSRGTIMPHSSAVFVPSSATITPKITPSIHVDIPVVQMMILSTDEEMKNQPKLPNEIGFGDGIGRAMNPDESEYRNIRYLYANVLIPVMSGLCGALLITLGIIIYRCLRRRKLQKVRYYGGKPDSALYRLDQSMSLLAELTSDEED